MWSPSTGAAAIPAGASNDATTSDVAGRDVRFGDQRDRRSGRQREAVAAGIDQGRIGELAGDLLGELAEGIQVARMELDGVQVGDPDPIAGRPTLALHRTLDPVLHLDRLDVGPEEARGGSFEEALEQSLEPRQGWHGRPESSRGRGWGRPAPLTFGMARTVPAAEGPGRVLRYNLAPIGSVRADPVRPRAEGSMPEILTELFCERCGTRYTFEAAEPKGKRLGKFKVLSKGFVNFVSNDQTSFDEAFAEARSDEQRELTNQQLDAFHQTFQFCMSCRQYTCANCWNEVESRCLSCAPHLGTDVLDAPFRTSDPLARIFGDTPADAHAANGVGNGNGNGAVAPSSIGPAVSPPAPVEPSAWPSADLVAEPAADATPPLGAGPTDAPPTAWPSTEPGIVVEGTPSPAAALAPAIPDDRVAGAIDETVDDDVAQAVAAAESARHAHDAEPAAVDGELEAAAAAQRQAEFEAAAAAQRQAEFEAAALAAEAERQRQAEFEAAALAAEAERQRQAAAEAEALAAEAERQRQAEAAAETERQRQAAAAAAAALALHAAAETERTLQAEADAATEAERQRTAQAQAEAAEAERQRAAQAEADRLALAAIEAERLREAQAEADQQALAAIEAERRQQADAQAERERVAREDEDKRRQAEAAAAAAAAQTSNLLDRFRPGQEPSGGANGVDIAASAPIVPPAVPDDRVMTPTWQIVAPEPTGDPAAAPEPGLLDVPPAILAPQPPLPTAPSNGVAAGGNGTGPSSNGATPGWPSPATTPPPQWPMPTAEAPVWPTQPVQGADAMWAASSQDVVSREGSGVQSCVGCGLALSSSARFCRRCGTPQH